MRALYGVVASTAALVAAGAASPFELSNVFGDNAVLQRDRPALVWGFGATAGSTVSAVHRGKSVECPVDPQGVWRCELPTTPSGGPYNISFTSSAGQATSMNNVLFGDVYFASGQSNMVFTVSTSFNASEEIADATPANWPTIRVFSASENGGSFPQQQLDHAPTVPWSPVSAASINGTAFTYFSAVAYFFARDLTRHLDASVPIGIVVSAVGGTIIQKWSPPSALAQCSNPPNASFQYSTLYNGMVAPFALGPMQLTGMLYYQAESNIDYVGPGEGGAYYSCQFPATIASWRQAFGQGSLPFFFVQLAAYTAKSDYETSIDILPDMRAGQLAGTALPNVSFVTAMDCGDIGSPFTDIHPRLKQPVGQRLADLVATQLYGMQGINYAAPRYANATVLTPPSPGTAAVRVTFSGLPAGDALVFAAGQACPPSYNASAVCRAFEVQFSDGSSVEVQRNAVTIGDDGASIVITVPTRALASADGLQSPPVPVATRYAYAPWPVTSLYTALGGYPVVPWSETI